MKKLVLILGLATVLVVGLIWAYRQASQERLAETEGERPVRSQTHLRRSPEGLWVLSLNTEAQERLGLVVGCPTSVSLPRRLKAYGRVLDPGPLVGLLAEIQSAEAALEASSREFQRLKQLHAQGQNVALRAVEAAEATLRRDQVAREAARLKLLNSWGKAVGEAPDLPSLVEELVARQAALVRLDVPAGSRVEPPRAAEVFRLDAPDQPLKASYLGPAAEVDPQAQGTGYLFVIRDKACAGPLAPGQALWGWLEQPGAPVAGWLVPSSAVVRAAGQGWVYVQTDGTNFARRPIGLDHPVEQGWVVSEGLSAQDRLVLTGAQMLLSEEFKARIQLGD